MRPAAPGLTEIVIAVKRDQGRVTVHSYRRGRWSSRPVTDCGRPLATHWIWLEYRTLNPGLADLCSRCWDQP